MLSVAEARARVLAAVEALDPVSVLVADALGLTVAEDLRAPHPLPRFDNSAMDGYAVRAADTTDAPVELRVTGEVRAGSISTEEGLAPGTAVRIMTGAPVPEGADAIVPVEVTEESGDVVRILESVQAGRHVRPAGDDVDTGQLVLAAGMELGSGELALVASLGLSPVPVRPRPRVAILVTGDELVPPEEEPGSGQIRDSNSIALGALVREAGAEPQLMPHVPDDRAATLDAFKRAGEDADLVVSSGGVAVGRYDFVKEVVEELGRIDMWRVAMQPGKPVVLGSLGATPFLGLPGNPVSIHVSFEQFVRPAIRKMRGCATLFRPTITAQLTETISKRPGRLHFVRVRLSASGEGWGATPTGPQGSHIQSSLVGTHGVAVFERDLDRLEAGSTVEVQVWSLPGGEVS
jgi:molybdopterin molybdotransferase